MSTQDKTGSKGKRTGNASPTRRRASESSSTSTGDTDLLARHPSETTGKTTVVETAVETDVEPTVMRRHSAETSSMREYFGKTSSTRGVSGDIGLTGKPTVETALTRKRSDESGSTRKHAGKTSSTRKRTGESSSSGKPTGKTSSTRRSRGSVETSSTSKRNGETSSPSKRRGKTRSTRKRTDETSLTSKRTGKSGSMRNGSADTSSASKPTGKTGLTRSGSAKTGSTRGLSGDISLTGKRTGETALTGKPEDKPEHKPEDKSKENTGSVRKRTGKTSSTRKRRKAHKSSSGSEHALEVGLNSLGLHGLVVAYKMARFALRGLAISPIVLTMPLMLLLASTLTDYLVLLNPANSSTLLFFAAMPVPVEDVRRADAESVKKSIQAVLYLITLCLCAAHWRAVKDYVKNWPHLGLLIAILLFSATYSVEPTKVITNSILILVSILMPLLFVIGQRKEKGRLQSFYLLVFIPIFLSHLASLMLLFTYGTDPIEIVFSERRYGGFSGNPNSLGNTAALGLWASFALVLSSNISRHWHFLAVLSLPLFASSIAMSGSGTATVASVLIIGLMVWMRVLATFKPTVRLVVNVFSAILFALGILSVLLMVTPAELFLVFTGSLGKDASLTGRTDLWDIAKDAIAQRPLLGWSFDSHTSVMAEREYEVPYNHYHNGFLDTVIEGGMLLMCVVLYNFGRYVTHFLKLFRQTNHVYPLVVPFIMIIILNMSEYSLLRPLSVVWQLYIACFVIMTYKYIDTNVQRKPPTKKNTSTGKSRRKRKRTSLRWA